MTDEERAIERLAPPREDSGRGEIVKVSRAEPLCSPGQPLDRIVDDVEPQRLDAAPGAPGFAPEDGCFGPARRKGHEREAAAEGDQ